PSGSRRISLRSSRLPLLRARLDHFLAATFEPPRLGFTPVCVVPAGTGAGGLLASVPAYFETKSATASASAPTTTFWGMIAPEKPPFRIAKSTSSFLSFRLLRFGPVGRSPRIDPRVPAAFRVWHPAQRSAKSLAP